LVLLDDKRNQRLRRDLVLKGDVEGMVELDEIGKKNAILV